jgi:ABC-type multidrug transport system ATPase subunit
MLTWEQLSLSISVGKQQFKEILKGVSGEAIPGEVLAILGTSGAGKTTLLNTLNGWVRSSKTRILTGDVKANGLPIRDFNYSLFTGYVLQEDILLATMTVGECMRFSARLKLSGSEESKKAKAMEVVDQLLLTGVKDSRIGDEKLRGISGGEKKRVCIGVELVTNPSVLFLDEPTSGLDSFTALTTMKLIKTQAKLGRTVVCTLHQPSSQIVELIDKLLVMSNGHTVYHDIPTNCRAHFEGLNYKFPTFGNPADFLMHIISSRDLDGASVEARDMKLIEAYKAAKKPLPIKAFENYSTVEELKATRPSPASFGTQFAALLGRAIKETLRDPNKFKVKVFIAVYLSLLMIVLFHNLGTNFSSIQNRNGLLFMACSSMIFTGIDGIVLNFPKQRAVFIKEQASNMYGVLPYYLAKVLQDMYLEVLTPTIYFVLVYWSCSLNTSDDTKPLLFWLLCLLTSFCGSSIGLIIGCAASNVNVAIQLVPAFAVPMMVYSGFLVNYDSLPDATKWLSYLSPYRYSFSGLAENEYHGISFDCEDDPTFPCHPLGDLNLELNMTEDIIFLASVSIGLRIMAGFMLKLLVKRIYG